MSDIVSRCTGCARSMYHSYVGEDPIRLVPECGWCGATLVFEEPPRTSPPSQRSKNINHRWCERCHERVQVMSRGGAPVEVRCLSCGGPTVTIPEETLVTWDGSPG